jgi:hypothetical protein
MSRFHNDDSKCKDVINGPTRGLDDFKKNWCEQNRRMGKIKKYVEELKGLVKRIGNFIQTLLAPLIAILQKTRHTKKQRTQENLEERYTS